MVRLYVRLPQLILENSVNFFLKNRLEVISPSWAKQTYEKLKNRLIHVKWLQNFQKFVNYGEVVCTDLSTHYRGFRKKKFQINRPEVILIKC